MTTHTSASSLAATLAELGETNGTLVSLILRKKGVSRGPASNPTVYDDDLVQVLLWTGYPYKKMIQQSYAKLQNLWGSAKLVNSLAHATGVSRETAAVAVQELDTSLRLAASDTPPKEDVSSPWEPLTVDGKEIMGAKVYTKISDQPNAPKPGTVYLDGLKLGEVILDPAKNGHWTKISKDLTKAKERLKTMLPYGLYVSYSLDSERFVAAKVGQDAVDSAQKNGIHFDPTALKELFSVGPNPSEE